jgi:hypothetical protein
MHGIMDVYLFRKVNLRYYGQFDRRNAQFNIFCIDECLLGMLVV